MHSYTAAVVSTHINKSKPQSPSHVHTHIRFLHRLRISADMGNINFNQFSVYKRISHPQLQTFTNAVATLQFFNSTLKHV